ncbi:MAG: rane-associated protein in eicosanoid and glutathione metabolism [Rhodospirillales bacterium]|nr:rane-associated protein in eicosanoid and glutathione metabolism [Rhodospirillales bacterium]
MQHRDLFPALVTCLALLVYAWNFMSAGQARGKHKIQAPATAGHPEFERKLRIQENMIEQLIVFLPSLWIFCLTVQPLIGAALGLVFVIGRIIYSLAYAADPSKRGLGFGLGIFPTLILLLGGLVGVIRDFMIDM